jgi:secreted trypsin-like serine protease
LSIIGGKETKQLEFPWMASLQFNGHFCGASLISKKWLLTAAHCVYNINPRDMKVILGEHYFKNPKGTKREFSVKKVIKFQKILGFYFLKTFIDKNF